VATVHRRPDVRVRFIEDNWQLARIGNGTFDQMADRLTGLLDVSGGPAVFIDLRTGE